MMEKTNFDVVYVAAAMQLCGRSHKNRSGSG